MEQPVELPALMIRGSEPRTVALREMRQHLAALRGQPVTLDCETTGVELGRPQAGVRTAQIGNEYAAAVFDAADPLQMLVVRDVLDNASEIIAHAATADVSLLSLHLGVDPAPWWDKTTDTMVLAALSPAAAVGEKLGLEALTARLLGTGAYKPQTAAARKSLFSSNGWLTNTQPDTPVERNGWAQVDHRDPVMLRYDAADVLDTAALRAALADPSEVVMRRERTLSGVLARVYERGIALDPQRVRELLHSAQSAAEQAAQGLQTEYGLVNPNSTRETAEVLAGLGAEDLPRTKTGAVSVNVSALEDLRELDTPAGAFSRALLNYRAYSKQAGTYLLPMALQTADGADGRAHPVIQQLGARATGRMSARNPNIQNFPRPNETEAHTTGGMRGMFVADPGTRLISADFSSVEVRLAAAAAGDQTLLGMIRDGLDLHGRIVEQVWSLRPGDDGFKDARYMAKRTVFGYLYGAGLARLAQQLGAHGDRAGEVLAALQSITPELTRFNDRLRTLVRTGRQQSWQHPSGRIVYFDRERPHTALNYVVQGWGREVLVDAILDWEKMHPGCTLWPIHDELVIQVPEDSAEAWTRDLVTCMTRVAGAPGAQVDVVCEADAPTDRWGISHEFKI